MQTFLLNANGIACFWCIRGKKAQRRLSSSRCYATKAEALRCPSASKGLFAPPTPFFAASQHPGAAIKGVSDCLLLAASPPQGGEDGAQDHLLFFLLAFIHSHILLSSVCASVCVCECVCACTLTQPECMYLLPFFPINSNHPASLAESDDRLGGPKNTLECLWPLYTVIS